MSKTTCSPSVVQLYLATILALSLAPQAGLAANTVSATKTQNLDFGAFVVLPSCNNCTIDMTDTGQRTAGPGIVLMDNINMGKAGQLNVTCNNTVCPFTMSTPAGVTMSAGGVNLGVGSYIVTRTSTSTPSTISVGGRLTIPRSGSTPNSYTKNFTFTITSP